MGRGLVGDVDENFIFWTLSQRIWCLENFSSYKARWQLSQEKGRRGQQESRVILSASVSTL